MKMKKLLGIIALVAVIGFGVIGCDNGTNDGGETTDLDGTWFDSVEGTRLVISNGRITVSNYDDSGDSWIEIMKGTISTSGSSLTVNFTQVSGAAFGEDGANVGLSSTEWYTQASLRTTVIQYLVANGTAANEAAAGEMFDQYYGDEVNAQFQPQTGPYTLSGNTLTVVLGGNTTVFTKNGSYTAPPWRWNVYADSDNNDGNSSIAMTESSGTLTFSGNVANKDNGDNGYVGINATPNAANLASLKTSASITFDVRGDGKKYTLRVATSDITDYSYYKAEFTTTANTWKTITVNIPGDLENPGWGESSEGKTFDQTKVQRIEIQPYWEVTGSFSISIRNLTLNQSSSGDSWSNVTSFAQMDGTWVGSIVITGRSLRELINYDGHDWVTDSMAIMDENVEVTGIVEVTNIIDTTASVVYTNYKFIFTFSGGNIATVWTQIRDFYITYNTQWVENEWDVDDATYTLWETDDSPPYRLEANDIAGMLAGYKINQDGTKLLPLGGVTDPGAPEIALIKQTVPSSIDYFRGIWANDGTGDGQIRIIAMNGHFTQTINGVLFGRGTYEVSGTTAATITFTEMNSEFQSGTVSWVPFNEAGVQMDQVYQITIASDFQSFTTDEQLTFERN